MELDYLLQFLAELAANNTTAWVATHRPEYQRARAACTELVRQVLTEVAAEDPDLADLNTRLAQPVPMNRFRPNLVFGGGQPYEDDQWENLQIGQVAFRAVRGCGRCVLTTIDQNTALKQASGEPLRTLATYRQAESSTLFGQNVTGPGAGRLRVGDTLTVLSRK